MKNIDDIAAFVRGKNIALVGNSRNVLGKRYPVDRHDVVIRMNDAWNLPTDLQECVGSRIDILCISGGKKHLEHLIKKIPHIILMTPKNRDTLSHAVTEEIFFYPVEWWRILYEKLGSRPSTGCMAVDMFSRMLGDGRLTLYGFDFFKSPSWHKRYSIRERINLWLGKKIDDIPHKGNVEEEFIKQCLPADQLHIISPE